MDARGSTSRIFPARPLRGLVALALLIPQLTGCYHYVPVSSMALADDAEVMVGITDHGRVELAQPVGPGVQHLGGRVAMRTDTSLVLSVNSVQYMDLAQPVRWRGERVEIRRDLTSEIRERKLSRPRTWLMIGLVTVGGFMASRIAIVGFGGEPADQRPGGGDPGQQ
jgi:hypothetical protein